MVVQDQDLRVLNQHIEPKEFKLSPASARQYDVDNHFKRSLSYIVGHDGTEFHLIKTNTRGEIVTASTGSTVTGYEVYNVTLTAGSGGTWQKIWESPLVALQIYYKGGDALFKFAFAPAGVFGAPIELPTGFWVLDYPILGLEIDENGGATDVNIQVVAFY